MRRKQDEEANLAKNMQQEAYQSLKKGKDTKGIGHRWLNSIAIFAQKMRSIQKNRNIDGLKNPSMRIYKGLKGKEAKEKQDEESSMSCTTSEDYPLHLDMVKNVVITKHNYQNELKENIMWEGEILEDKVSNHIVILGYIDGLNYFVDAIRRESDIPIII